MRTIFVVLAILVASPALAGSVDFTDRSGVISDAQADSLESYATNLPFEAKIFIDSFGSKATLDAQMSACITGPNDVCIGVDPFLRTVNVHFGTGTGIPKSDYASISAAGNGSFKVGQWMRGVREILERAKLSAMQNTKRAPTVVPDVKVTREQPASDNTWLWIILALLSPFCVFGLAWYVVNRQNKLEAEMREREKTEALLQMERDRDRRAAERRQRDAERDASFRRGLEQEKPAVVKVPKKAEHQPPTSPSPITPAPTPTVVNDFTSGFLMAQVMNEPKPAPAPTPKPEPARETHRSFSSSKSSDDGGSSSSWSSSYDSGGSSSDFGGGGFDGGGGGSDF